MLQLIGGTVGMMDISRGLNPQQVRSINKAVRGVQVSNGTAPESCFAAVFSSHNSTLSELQHTSDAMHPHKHYQAVLQPRLGTVSPMLIFRVL